MDDHFALLADIEAFCRVQGIAESTFGRQVVNDGKFVGRLRDDQNIDRSKVSPSPSTVFSAEGWWLACSARS